MPRPRSIFRRSSPARSASPSISPRAMPAPPPAGSLAVVTVQYGPGAESCVRRHRPGLQRPRADPVPADRLSARFGSGGPQFRSPAQLPSHHQMVRGGEPGRGPAQADACGHFAGPQRRARRRSCWNCRSICWRKAITCIAGDLSAARGAACRRPSDGEIAELVETLMRRQKSGDLGGAGRACRLGASAELVEFAELRPFPVMTTPNGKSGFPENHPLALGTAGRARPATVDHFLDKADVVLALGSSLTRSYYILPIPADKTLLQVTHRRGGSRQGLSDRPRRGRRRRLGAEADDRAHSSRCPGHVATSSAPT